MNTNAQRFETYLKAEYERLFRDDTEYAYAASTTTPDVLAKKMTDALSRGLANKDGKAIKRACGAFGIKHTYKAISEFLKVQP